MEVTVGETVKDFNSQAMYGVEELVHAAFWEVILGHNKNLAEAAKESYYHALDPDDILWMGPSPLKDWLEIFSNEDAAVQAARKAVLKITGGNDTNTRTVDPKTGRTILGDSRYDGPNEQFYNAVATALRSLHQDLAVLVVELSHKVREARHQLALALVAADQALPDPTQAAMEAARRLGEDHRAQAQAALETWATPSGAGRRGVALPAVWFPSVPGT